VITATSNISEAARDFVSMLPLAIEMDDHLPREKTGVIPGPLSEQTAGTRTYELGDLSAQLVTIPRSRRSAIERLRLLSTSRIISVSSRSALLT
jgi:hypothetical protein